MATRIFCDICDRNMTDDKELSPVLICNKVEIPLVLRKIKEVTVCNYCIIGAFMALDDRPKADPAAPTPAKAKA